VAFESTASNLVTGDTNGTFDVFLHDRASGATRRVSIRSDGGQGNGVGVGSGDASISDDGRLVAFDSESTNLVPGDRNGQPDVFVHDMLTRATRRVSESSSGTEARGGEFGSYLPAISGSGRLVSFGSDATDLVPGDLNHAFDVFVHDRVRHVVFRASVRATGPTSESFVGSSKSALSMDGRFVAFDSDAPNLVRKDTNGERDVFVRDRRPPDDTTLANEAPTATRTATPLPLAGTRWRPFREGVPETAVLGGGQAR
jgi:hypothetical protein